MISCTPPHAFRMATCRQHTIRWVLLIAVYAHLLSVPAECARGDTEDILSAQIVAAWNSRRDAVESFKYECRLRKTILIEPNYSSDPGDPFATAHPTDLRDAETLVLEGSFVFASSDGKMAYFLNTGHWNPGVNERSDKIMNAAFDGTIERRMIKESGEAYLIAANRQELGTGRVDVKDSPSQLFRTHRNLESLWLAHDPVEWLRERRYSPERIEVTNMNSFVGGDRAVELQVPGESAGRTARLYVDPNREFLPTRAIRKYRGVIQDEVQLEYEGAPTGEWGVSEFTYMQYRDGSIITSLTVQVERHVINEPLDDDLFVWDFPEGTHVRDHTVDGEERYFIATSRGGRNYISSEEFGVVSVGPSGGLGRWMIILTLTVLLFAASMCVYLRLKGHFRA